MGPPNQRLCQGEKRRAKERVRNTGKCQRGTKAHNPTPTSLNSHPKGNSHPACPGPPQDRTGNDTQVPPLLGLSRELSKNADAQAPLLTSRTRISAVEVRSPHLLHPWIQKVIRFQNLNRASVHFSQHWGGRGRKVFTVEKFSINHDNPSLNGSKIGRFTQESRGHTGKHTQGPRAQDHVLSQSPGNQAPGPVTISKGPSVPQVQPRRLVASGLAAEVASAAGHRWRAASQTICRAMEAQGSWARV